MACATKQLMEGSASEPGAAFGTQMLVGTRHRCPGLLLHPSVAWGGRPHQL